MPSSHRRQNSREPSQGGEPDGEDNGRGDSGSRKPRRPRGAPSNPGGDDDDNGGSGSDAEVDGLDPGGSKALLQLLRRANQKSRVEERDKIEIAKMPNVIEFRARKITVRSEVAAASGLGDEGLKWIMEVEKHGATFESSASSGKCHTLDIKLAAALNHASTGTVGREIATATEKAAQNDKLLRGRQALWLVYRWCATNQEAGALYELTDLLISGLPI